jgi:hypothetical protein
MTIGNLNVIFIGEKEKLDLLDRWDEYVNLVFSEGYNYGKHPEFVLKDIRISKLHKTNPAIIGRFVKSTILKVEQVLKDGELIPRNEKHDSAPSSFFIYLLKTHILIFLPENPGAPNVGSFKTFVEQSINKERLKFIRQMNKGKRGEEKFTIVEENPPAHASYIPIPMMSSLGSQFEKISKIKRIWIRHFYQNANLDIKSWINGDNAVLQALKAPKIDHTITQVGDVKATRDFVEDIVKANNASFKVEGKGETGDIVFSNDGVQYIRYDIPDYERNEDVLSVAEKLFGVYKTDVQVGNIPNIQDKNDPIKIAKAFKFNEKKG